MECSPNRSCRKDSELHAEVVMGGGDGGDGKSCKCKAGIEKCKGGQRAICKQLTH